MSLVALPLKNFQASISATMKKRWEERKNTYIEIEQGLLNQKRVLLHPIIWLIPPQKCDSQKIGILAVF